MSSLDPQGPLLWPDPQDDDTCELSAEELAELQETVDDRRIEDWRDHESR